MRNAWNWHNGEVAPPRIGDWDNNVPRLDRMFPHEANQTSRLIGLLNSFDVIKVTTMKIVPMREKQDATRSVISSDLD